ncbi:hypothetical protein TVAG_378520 [Trichomonas vaginalis G3]|uniref:Uncharacterized protein n=1 Tax=Trichomonas vaginalis (strain ATCC PRA-98 / G3) TaxID=412133 RepID=A2DB43_TRIV3|nr:armadillo (ARM) repeat-containing protein family [Trichomonas vaginalis G3]EAY22373.1 hypothetical protein TVAG_378520 [Trichomonas vaginalis G3]KAI5517700.1 armadillo (ARM) repeat-containing protein family [Trichomonas vaginalis G3]|eukprot:XP_001583359.1 hypothetical protein [Trichomonas vaginalis G3]
MNEIQKDFDENSNISNDDIKEVPKQTEEVINLVNFIQENSNNEEIFGQSLHQLVEILINNSRNDLQLLKCIDHTKILEDFMSFLFSENKDIVLDSLKLLSAITTYNTQYSSLIFQNEMLSNYLKLFESSCNEITMNLMILILNNMKGFQELCLLFYDYFIREPENYSLTPYYALFTLKELDYFQKLDNFQYAKIIESLELYIESGQKDAIIYSGLAIIKGIKHNIEPFREHCVKHDWNDLFLTKFVFHPFLLVKKVGYKGLRAILIYIPHEFLCESNFAPIKSIFDGLFPPDESTCQMLNYLNEYIERFPSFINIFVVETIENDLTCFDHMISLLLDRTQIYSYWCIKVINSIIMNVSKSQLNKMHPDVIIPLILEWIETTDDNTFIGEILTALQVWINCMQNDTAREFLCECFNILNTEHIFNELAESDDEYIADLSTKIFKQLTS